MKKISILILLFSLFCIPVEAEKQTIYNNATCISGNCINGTGVLKFTNRNKYEGGFKEGFFDGYGELIWSTYTYKGNYLNGKRNGFGKLISKNSSYEGNFENGDYHGEGVLSLKGGVLKKGNFYKSRFIENIKQIKPQADNTVIPVQINIIQVNHSDLILMATDERIKNIEADINYANYIWQKAGFYFDFVSLDKVNIEIPKDFKKSKERIKKTNFRKVENHEKLRKYSLKLFDHKKNRNKKAINVYYFSYELIAPGGLRCGWADMKSKKDRIIFMPYANLDCPLQSWTLAHEFGHALGIHHAGIEGRDLMQESGWGENIPSSEIKKAQRFYNKNLKNFSN